MTQGPTPKLMGPNSPRRISWQTFQPEEPSKNASTVRRIPKANRMMAHIWFRCSRSSLASSAEVRRAVCIFAAVFWELFFFAPLDTVLPEAVVFFFADGFWVADCFFAAISSPCLSKFQSNLLCILSIIRTVCRIFRKFVGLPPADAGSRSFGIYRWAAANSLRAVCGPLSFSGNLLTREIPCQQCFSSSKGPGTAVPGKNRGSR